MKMAIIDLSIPLTINLKLLPTLPGVSISSILTIVLRWQITAPVSRLFVNSVCRIVGTHIDARFICARGKDISQIPVDSLMGGQC